MDVLPRPGRWVAIDYAVTALLVFGYALVFRAPAHLDGIPLWASAVLIAVAVLPAAVRRCRPLAALTSVTVATAVVMALSSSPPPAIVVAFVMYLIPLRLPQREARVALAATLLIIAAGLSEYAVLPHGVEGTGGIASAAERFAESSVLVVGGWSIGLVVRRQRAQARRRVHEQLAEARRATTEERLQIARELHDVVAHSMSLIAVQAGVANYVIGEHPEEAARALASIEQTSRGALREMRALLEMLRAEPVGLTNDAPGPAPGLADLEDLVARTAEAGVRVELNVDVREERPLVSPGIDLAAYRVIQEALTNVIKHAATDHCRVTVACRPDALSVEIADDGPGALRRDSADSTAGHGIPGMQERTLMYGGELQAGPLPTGGFRVAARFPLSRAAA